MRISTFILSIALICLTQQSNLFSQEKPPLAVLDFTAEGLTIQESRFLTNRLRTQLGQIGGFDVLGRSEMETIFESRNYNDFDCITDECAVRAGRILGVDMVVSGVIGKLGSTYTIDIRLVDIATSDVLWMKSYTHYGFVDGMISEVMDVAAKNITNYYDVEDLPLRKRVRASPTGEPGVAVLDFQANGISQSDVMTLTDRLRSKLSLRGDFEVVERGSMEGILLDHDFTLSGCTSAECAVEVGKLLGVTHMIAGNIGKIGSMFTIDLRVVSVASGEIVQSISKDYQGEIEGLVGLMTVIANEFVGISTPQEASTQPNYMSILSNEDKASAENTNSLTTVDEIYDSISEDVLGSFSVGDSVYVCEYYGGAYSWNEGVILGIDTKKRSRIQVEIDGKTKIKSADNIVRKYAWLNPYRDGFGLDHLKIGDKVLARVLTRGIAKAIVTKIKSNGFITIETQRIVQGLLKVKSSQVKASAIAMIRVSIVNNESSPLPASMPTDLSKSDHCYENGFDSGTASKSGGAFLGNFAGGLAFGLIGWGVTWALTAASDPIPPRVETADLDSECHSEYKLGYRTGKKNQNNILALIGGGLGTLIFFIVANQ